MEFQMKRLAVFPRIHVPAMIFLAAIYLPAASQAAFTFSELKKSIDDQSAQGQASVESILQALPEDHLKNFTLVHKSRSRMQDSSFLNPRAILFGSTGDLYITFNGDPKQKGFSALELLAFDPKKAAFELHEVKFEKGKAYWSETNPKQCTVCHGDKPAPIWESYDQWPGVFGSNDDYLAKHERPSFLEFKALKDQHPRYSKLKFASDSLAPYRNSDFGDAAIGLAVRPNAKMTLLAVTNHALGIARTLVDNPKLKALALSTAAHACIYSPQFPEFSKLLASKLDQHPLLQSQKIDKSLSTSLNLRKIILALGYRDQLSLKPSMITRNPQKPPVPFDQPTVTGLIGNIEGMTQGKTHDVFQSLVNHTLQLLVQQDHQYSLPTKSTFASYESDYPSFLKGEAALVKHLAERNPFLDFTNPVAKNLVCDRLLKDSIEALSKNFSLADLPISQMNAKGPAFPLKRNGLQLLDQAKCIACHHPTDRSKLIGPFIPFGDKAAFKSYKEDMNTFGIDWKASLNSILSTKLDAHQRMPLTGPDFTPEEISTLIKYLEGQ